MRRSTLDIRFGREILRVSQTWACQCCGTTWKVRQVSRIDCTATLVRPGERREITFEELRAKWKQVHADQQQEAA